MERSSQELTHLLNRLADQQEPVSESLLYSLSDLNRQGVLEFQAAWDEISPARRHAIASILVTLAEEHIEVNFDAVFRQCFDDPEAAVRTAAVEGLWENEDVALIGPLARLLEEDEDPGVRSAAAISLGRFVLLGELEEIEAAAAFRAESALWSALHAEDEDIEVLRRAVEAIAYSGEMAVRDVIRDAYYYDDERMRTSALFAMGRSADPYWRDLVLRELESDHPSLRFEATRAVGELELNEAIPYLIALLAEDDAEVREAAIIALGQIGGEEARRALLECLDSEDESIRDAADIALEMLQSHEGMDDIPLINWDSQNDEGFEFLFDDED